jgi:outer membrane protein
MCTFNCITMRSILFFLAGFFVSAHAAFAQQTLSLEQCLNLAVENNIQVKLNENVLETSALNQIQRKFDFLPTVSANLGVNKSFGNSADIFTQQIAVSPWTSNPNLGASLIVFKGMSKWSELKSANYNVASNRYSLEDLKNDIRLNTAVAFFQTIFAGDNLQIARNRIALLEQQLAVLHNQIDAGTKTQGDLYTLEAQVATEKVNEITQLNTYNRGLLDLKLILNLNPSEDYTLLRPEILDAEMAALEDTESIYEAASLNNPGVLKQQFKALSTKYAVNSARALYMPTLSVNMGLTSFYSSNSKERIGYTIIDGFPAILYGDPIPIGKQFSANFSKTLAISLSVPIFNRLSTRQNYLISKVNYSSALLNIQSEQQDLYKSIQQAHLDAEAADAKFLATTSQLRSLELSYTYAEARFNAGMLDHYAFMEVLNNRTKAEIENLQAKYDRMLKRRILDIYQGKPLQF